MQVYLFLDLDDTLFQTRPKCGPVAEADLIPAALSRDGTPLSYMTKTQRRMLDWLSADAIVIPVTARSHDAFSRVQLPFHHAAVLDFGGVVLEPGGGLDHAWDRQIRPQALAKREALEAICDEWQRYSDDRRLGVRVRVISDFGMPFYVVAKHPAGDVAGLRALFEWDGEELESNGYCVHFNDNNLSVIPSFLGKRPAVRYLLQKYAGTEQVLTIGMGDSLTDAPFLEACDFALIPQSSQLLRMLKGVGEPHLG